MNVKMENPGGQAGASLDHTKTSWRYHSTASDRQAQMLASRFCLSPWVAQDMSRLCFGEGCHD